MSIGLLVILAIPFITALFVQTDYAVVRSVTINQPLPKVFEYIRLLKNQNDYSVWAKADPDTKHSYLGNDGAVGFISIWESENPEVGFGEQEIKNIIPNQRIEFELRFFKPFEATEPAYMTTESVNDSETKVSWGFNGHIDYPLNLMFLFVDFEDQIGGDLQEGLQNLKVILEK
ncbi:MAG: SRPBCC family protein [Shewanella sp.]|nr:SRPBCC family protein [Shewanella sp.]